MTESQLLKEVVDWLWTNKEWVAERLSGLRRWLFAPKEVAGQPTSRILIIGPGGVGKSTTAALFAGKHDTLLSVPSNYAESIGLERFALKDDPTVELIVPPGQQHRRDATWVDLQRDIANGSYRGVINLVAYGYHTIGQISFRQHRLYKGNDDAFLTGYLDACRQDESAVLERLAPHIMACNRKLWLLTLATKQDLWWPRHSIVESHYNEGAYGATLAKISSQLGRHNFRHEFVPVSLVISNFGTGLGEILAETTAGYDQNRQVVSLKRLWETLSALKQWEEEA